MRSADVHCHFESYDKLLLPGMYMNADVELKLSNVETINEDAIISFEGKDYVFVSKSKLQFEMIEVKKGSSENNFTEVNSIDGKDILSAQIVTKGAYSLLMQLKNKSEE